MNANSTEYGALVLRLALGAMFIAHGLLKIMVFTLPGTVQFFQSLGLPGLLAYVTVLVELAVGALLIVGYQSRIAALVALPILLGAAWVHWPNGWVFSAANGGWEYPVFLAVAAIVQALLGDGAYALGQSKQETRARLARA
jgi:putative oxidoreductase